MKPFGHKINLFYYIIKIVHIYTINCILNISYIKIAITRDKLIP